MNLWHGARVKKITVAVSDAVYRTARIRAAEQGRSVSSLVTEFLEGLTTRDVAFSQLEALQHQVQEEVTRFRASDRLDRTEVHDRALR